MFLRMKLFSRLLISEAKFLCRKESSSTGTTKPYHLFFDETVQNLLRKITNVDYEKVFRPRGFGKELSPAVYELLTTEALEKEKEAMRKKANELLQIPPIVEMRKEIDEVLNVRPDLDGFDIDHSKFVFTDISHDVKNHERAIVVREPNGVLREAYWSERDRMNQVYAPIDGRQITMPKMFEDEHLKNVLDREEYEFILDRACIQFEPNDPMFHKVISVTFERINEHSHFEVLTSTRHFGALAFYLLINQKIDNMLIHFINSKRIDDAYSLVKLYHIINPNCSSAASSAGDDQIETLKQFIKLDSKAKPLLELTLQNYTQNEKESQILEKGIQQAHGLK